MIRLIVVFLSVIIVACSSQKDKNQLEDLLRVYSGSIDDGKLESFKSSNLDSSGNALDLISDELDLIYSEVIKNRNLNAEIDSFLVRNNISFLLMPKKVFLGVSLYAFLKERNIYGVEVVSRVKQIVRFRMQKKYYFNQSENRRIMYWNYKNIVHSDTFNIVLPVSVEYGRRCTFYYSGYPYANSYINADDSLVLKVFLVDKSFAYKTDGGVDSSDLIFKVKTIELSDDDVYQSKIASKEKYTVGGDFDLHLGYYGRIIKNQ